MKVLYLSILCVCLGIVSCHEDLSDWVEPTECKRPTDTTHRCYKAGSCCTEVTKEGTWKRTRTCEAADGDCGDHKLEETKSCYIRCRHDVSGGAYGDWSPPSHVADNCDRPATGDCSGPNTCCGQLVGTMSRTRPCLAPNGCADAALKRTIKCNVRCGIVHPCDRYPAACSNGGTCNKDGDGHSCSCRSGYTGHHCETDINECLADSDDCHDDATCSNTLGSYTCSCKAGFTGDGRNCQAETVVPNTDSRASCAADSHCPIHQVCDMGYCEG